MAKEEPKKMVHRAYTVITREGQDPFWLEIGASFEHKDGKGLTIALQAHPLDGRIVLRDLESGPRPKSERRGDDREKPEEDDERPTRSQKSSAPPKRPPYKSGR